MRTWTWLIAAALLVAACSDDDNPPPADTTGTPDAGADVLMSDGTTADAAVPTATFKALEAYSGHQGTATLETEVNDVVTKIELLAGGTVVATADAAPFTLDWDTTQSDDGMVNLSLKAYADAETATSEEVPVVVYNNGETATFIGGSDAATMEIDASGVGDFHIKWHWMMPEGIKRVIAVAFWDNPAFEMDLALGMGTCPHSGTEAARTDSATSPVLNDYDPGNQLSVDQWFAHVGATNESDLAGESTDMTIKVFLLK